MVFVALLIPSANTFVVVVVVVVVASPLVSMKLESPEALSV